jgi:glycerol-3-phosphate cytidylyltransferase-like family protein
MKITDVDYKYFMRYASLFYSNMGNIFDGGASKMIPSIPSKKFEEMLKTSNKFEEIKYIWDCVKEIIYDTSYNKSKDSLKRVNRNYFYLGDIKEEQASTVDNFLIQHDINPIYTRLMKISNKLVYLVSSTKKTNIEWEGTNIVGHYGIITIIIVF